MDQPAKKKWHQKGNADPQKKSSRAFSAPWAPTTPFPVFFFVLRPFPALFYKNGRALKNTLYPLLQIKKKLMGDSFFLKYERTETPRESTFHPPMFNGTSGVPPSTNVNGELEVEFSHVTLPPDCAFPASTRLVFPHPFPYTLYHCQPSGLLCTTLAVNGNQRRSHF